MPKIGYGSNKKVHIFILSMLQLLSALADPPLDAQRPQEVPDQQREGA